MNSAPGAGKHGISLWQGNLLIIGLLVIFTLGYYFWQVHKVEQRFLGHFMRDTVLLAEVLKRSADNTRLSHKVIQKIVGSFLANNARFIDYLQSIKPFSAEELEAFAQENGLEGVSIVSSKGKIVSGPPSWASDKSLDCRPAKEPLKYSAESQLYTYALPRLAGGCVLVGFKSKDIGKLKQSIGFENLSSALLELPDIKDIQLLAQDLEPGLKQGEISTQIREQGKRQIALAKVGLKKGMLRLELDAEHYSQIVRQIRQGFLIFVLVLLLLGLASSWMLFRLQKSAFLQAKNYERRLAQEKEDAALGRATATISHEIKNPLNSINMGLQRLEMEVSELSPEHRELLKTLSQAVKRSNCIIGNLRRYTSPIKPDKKQIDLIWILTRILDLHRNAFKEKQTELIEDHPESLVFWADPDLLSEVFENLVQNALESQDKGGWFRVSAKREEKGIKFFFTNPCSIEEAQKASSFFEPYFSTKARGTGLGLSIARQTVKAHEGRLELKQKKEELTFIVYL